MKALLVRRIVAAATLALAFGWGRCPAAADTAIGNLDQAVPGPSIEIQIQRGKTRIPASLVPYTKDGDMLVIKFPFADPRNQVHRFHALFADLHGIDTPHVDHYALFDNNNYEKDFIRPIHAGYTPVVLVFPESGTQKGRGVPQLSDKLRRSPELFLQAATASINAGQERARTDELLQALRSGLNKDLKDKRDRLTVFAQDLGVNLDQSCFGRTAGVQTPCLIHSVTSQLHNVSHDATKLIGDYAASTISRMLPIRYSYYLSIVLDLYFTFRHAQTPASYTLVPGALITRNNKTVLGLDKPFNVEATPEPVAYVTVPEPTTAPEDRPTITADLNDTTCLRAPKAVLPVLIQGDSSHYAWDWRLDLTDQAGHAQHDIAIKGATQISGAELDGTKVDHARFPSASRLKAFVTARWGFEEVVSDAFSVALPHHAAWHAEAYLPTTGGAGALLKLTGDAGNCVEKITIRDSSDHVANAVVNSRSDMQVIAALDLSALTPGAAQAVVQQDVRTSDIVPIVIPPHT